MGISRLNPSEGGIPYGDTAGRPSNPTTGKLYANGEIGRLELYTSTGWQNIVQETPGVASAAGHYYESDNYGTFTISGTNFVSGAIAYAVGTNGVEYQAQTTTYDSLVQLTVTFANLSAAYEPYDIKVTNPSNLFGLLPDAFYINEPPVWSTTAGSLGTYTGSSIQLAATDDESNTITYSLISGSLPDGLSLSSSGLISGTAAANQGTYSFTVSASDGINTAVTRSFSITIPYPTVTGGALTSDSTYYYRTFTSNGSLVVSGASLSCDYLIVAGGGGGGMDWYQDRSSGGGGAGGYRSFTSQSIISNTYVVTIGGGGAGGVQTGGTGVVGSNGIASSFNSITSTGGGGGSGHDNSGNYNAGNGGSGGGSTHDSSMRGFASPAGQGYDGGVSPNSIGGPGLQWLNGTYYAGGGAGSQSGGFIGGGGGGAGGTPSSGGFTGGAGGGGSSGSSSGTVTGGAGTANTGGGGGASRETTGGAGGSGIVIVRYTKASVGG